MTSWKLMGLGILGALACALIFLWGSPSSAASRAFVQTPQFVMWFGINLLLLETSCRRHFSAAFFPC